MSELPNDRWLLVWQWVCVAVLLANAVWSVAAEMPVWTKVIDFAGFAYVLVNAAVLTRKAQL
jgi:TM2 domain-containing membrane protein YozV